jgi:hypothetical protein
MISIIITQAPNGWIVREDGYGMTVPRVLAVFNKLDDLQAALPALLLAEQNETEGTKP